MNKIPGQVEITFEYSRHLGPRFEQGGVTLQFDSFRAYSFSSEAQWPQSQNYESAVRETVEAVLKERLGSLEKVAVILKSVRVHSVDACEHGFRCAARAATESAFQV